MAAGGLDAWIGRRCGRWMAAVDRHAGLVLAVVGLLTAAAAAYAALNLGIDAEPKTLINPELPFQRRQREIARTFHTLNDGILVVVEAESAVTAGRAADALATVLAKRTDLFSEVHVPGGGPFFARNALLYLEPAQLEDLVDRLSTVQPFLAAFSRDQSMVTVSDLLRDALAAARGGQRLGLDLPLVLERVSAAVEATTADRPAPDPWGSALLGDALPAEARRRVVALRPVLDYTALLNAAPAVATIRQAAAALRLDAAHGVRVRVTGDPVLNYEELIAIARQSRLAAVASFVLFSVAVCVALRSARVIAALLGSLLVSLAWTNAFAALAVGDLNQISAACNVFIVGLGGEFGIHACMRYAELCAGGRGHREALVQTGTTTGASLVSSAATTAIGFFVFLLTDFVGVAQLGLITGVGMILSLASTLTVVPALLAVGQPRPPRVRAAQPPWIRRLEHLPLAWARPIRWGSVALGLVALALVPRIRFDHNPLELRDPSTESVRAFEDLLDVRERSPWTIDVVTNGPGTAAALKSRLERLPTVLEARTLEDWVPAAQDEKREILETAAFFVPPLVADGAPPTPAAQRAALERLAAAAAETRAGAAPGLAAAAGRLEAALREFLARRGAEDDALRVLQQNVVGSLPAQVRDLRPMLSPDVVTRESLPLDLTRQYVAAGGRTRLEVFPREDVSDSATLERFVDDVRALVPDAGGMAVWLVEWGRVAWKSMRAALFGGMLAMVAFLLAMWRSTRDTVLAFFPLLLAAALTCATLTITGRPFNFANVIVLPMLIGMGVDNGVHLVHRHRVHAEEDVLATSTARAVFYAALTTVLAFGSLGFASHKGMASIGQLLTVGVALTLCCYVVVLPAWLVWDDRRRPRR